MYGYDDNGNLVRAANRHGITCFDYNPNGQLIGRHHWKVPTEAENQTLGLPETDWRDPQYDMLYLPQTESIRYHYDFNGNRTQTVLPDGRQINHLYYGSGHLHGILFDGDTVTDIERDKLHREISRTQGKLTSRYQLDPTGRLKAQIAQLAAPTEAKGKNTVSAGYAVKRSYGYDRTGNLTHSTDQRSGTTHYAYDNIGRITQAGDERFAFDPAHNILSDGYSGTVTDNRIKTYNGTSYYHDELGNLIHRELPNGEVQNFYYDLHDQLIKVEIFKKDGSKEVWHYVYDALGRRIGKYRETSDGLKAEEREFVWDGSHLLQEVYSNGRYTYIYTDVDSYEPLAQIHNYTNEEFETKQETNYFHCDQIGIPREMTDREGKLLWFGDYFGWGKLKSETNITGAHQPFRLQNQYFDRETGLHYNFFRYYEPDAGRFVNQDPIKLEGGENLYQFAPNTSSWIDPNGNIAFIPIIAAIGKGAAVGALTNIGIQIGKNVRDAALGNASWEQWDCINLTEVTISAIIGAIIPSAYKTMKCANQVFQNAKNLRNNKNKISNLQNHINRIFGKPNSGKQRRKLGREISKTNKAISANKANILKYSSIGVGIFIGSTIAKSIAGGEKQNIFGGGSCD